MSEWPTGSRLLASPGATPLAKLHAGLGEHPVHKSVGTAGRGSERTDALTVRVPLHQVLCESLAFGSDDPATLLGAGGGGGGCHGNSSRPRLSVLFGLTYSTASDDYAPDMTPPQTDT